MKNIILFFFLLSISLSAQDFKEVDSLVAKYPRYKTPQKLADKINSDFSLEIQKARAAFKWLTNNIRYTLKPNQVNKRSYSFSYSTEAERIKKNQEFINSIVYRTFLTKVGVCEEYAQSFKMLCDLLEIECTVIKGYVRNTYHEIGNAPNSTNHAWNAVKIDSKWILIDATSAAGFAMNGKWNKSYNDYFFDIPKEKIGLTHYPNERIWQVHLNQPSIDSFYKQPIYSQSFLNAGVELVSPKEGTITLAKNQPLILQVKKLKDTTSVRYVYNGQKHAKAAKKIKNENGHELLIENPGVSSSLLVFIDTGLGLQYRVNVR